MMARSLGGLLEVTAAEEVGWEGRRQRLGGDWCGQEILGHWWVSSVPPRGLRGRLWGSIVMSPGSKTWFSSLLAL